MSYFELKGFTIKIISSVWFDYTQVVILSRSIECSSSESVRKTKENKRGCRIKILGDIYVNY